MARLKQLRLSHFRNCANAKLELAPKLNLLIGDNAAGKTSVIEALWYLVSGRSFRSAQSKALIQSEQEEFVVFAELVTEQAAHLSHKIGLQKNSDQTLLRCDGQKLNSHAELARLLPIQMLTPESHKLLEEGPKARRQFMDWGCFHQSSDFIHHWRYYQRALKQRNQALKQKQSNQQIQLWDFALITSSEKISQLRQSYVEQLIPLVQSYCEILMPELQAPMECSFRPGWPLSQPDLGQLMQQNLLKDRQLGHTQYGAHRADLRFKFNGTEARQMLSRGQQKLFVCALLLAQAKLQQQLHQEPAIMLIDDLPAELDQQHRRTLMTLLDQLDIQHLVTSTAADLIEIIDPEQSAQWKIELGKIHPLPTAEIS